MFRLLYSDIRLGREYPSLIYSGSIDQVIEAYHDFLKGISYTDNTVEDVWIENSDGQEINIEDVL